MSPVWKPKNIQVYIDLVNTITEEAEGNLNNWERNFIVSIGDRLMKGTNLTELQAEKLEQIYATKTS